MSTLNDFRSLLYAVARLTGWVQAIRRGPDAVLRRAARSEVLTAAGKATNAAIPPQRRKARR